MTALPPGLPIKAYDQASVFEPGNLLREARRQKNLPDVPVPRVCLLDPDGDIATFMESSGRGHRHPGWACYHTDMWVTEECGTTIGVVGRAVGAPFAVLVAGQLFTSGAELVISIASAGQLQPLAQPPYFVLIGAALRDEGTSLHYRPAATWSELPSHLAATLSTALVNLEEPVITARSWTTDAPYRETTAAIASAAELGAACVEMEAAALYALAQARHYDIVCLAHITNTMARAGDDFEKGDANGAHASLALATLVAGLVRASNRLTNPPALSSVCDDDSAGGRGDDGRRRAAVTRGRVLGGGCGPVPWVRGSVPAGDRVSPGSGRAQRP